MQFHTRGLTVDDFKRGARQWMLSLPLPETKIIDTGLGWKVQWFKNILYNQHITIKISTQSNLVAQKTLLDPSLSVASTSAPNLNRHSTASFFAHATAVNNGVNDFSSSASMLAPL